MKDKEKTTYPYHIESPPEGNRVDAFLKAFESILENSTYRHILDLYSKVSMNCSRCAGECQIFQATGDPRDVPCHRSALLLRAYRRHFTLMGKIMSRILRRPAVTEREIDEILETYYHCTVCGRCTLFCPMGIDHRLVVRLGRFILSRIGIVPKALAVSVREQIEGPTRNTSGVPLKALKDNLEFLEEEIQEIKGVKVKFPLDVHGAEYVFFAPVSDYLVEAETLMGIACVLHKAGVSWTIASGNYDAINYGLFYNDEIMETIILSMAEEVKRIGGKKILIGECGHASRAASVFTNQFARTTDFPVVNIIELTADLLKAGRFELDSEAVKERITYHDPCNIARSGWVVDQPRDIIRSFIKNFTEMEPHGKMNLCCGGGGGTVSVNELKPYRMEFSGRSKARQLKATGADIVIAPCANCKKQLGELITHYKLPMKHAGLHDMIFTAIKMQDSEGRQ